MAYFRQIASVATDRFSYLLADMDRREAVIIDPAEDQVALYLSLLSEIQVRLVRILLTHGHGEALPGLLHMSSQTRAPLSAGERFGSCVVNKPLADGAVVDFGDELLHARWTPGHTAGCTSYFWRDRVFSGDTLPLDGVGRGGEADSDPAALFDSITQRLLTLPDETLVYPASSQRGPWVSCIGEQRRRNPFLVGVSRDEFITRHGQGSVAGMRNTELSNRRSNHDRS